MSSIFIFCPLLFTNRQSEARAQDKFLWTSGSRFIFPRKISRIWRPTLKQSCFWFEVYLLEGKRAHVKLAFISRAADDGFVCIVYSTENAERGDVLSCVLWAGTPRVGPPGGWQAAYRATNAATVATISRYMVQLDSRLRLCSSDDSFIFDWFNYNVNRAQRFFWHHRLKGCLFFSTDAGTIPEFHYWYQNITSVIPHCDSGLLVPKTWYCTTIC